MFRHRGKSRRLVHNLKLAALLSFVAGIVNVVGLFTTNILTTNVTGHFAYFSDELTKKQFSSASFFLLYILCFLAGAFFSNTIVEYFLKTSERRANAIPALVEILLLTVTIVVCISYPVGCERLIACILLFSMGLQNAMVTIISNSIVRTTHLTGLFTDLGIELSQIVFYRRPEYQSALRSSIKLRLAIIFFFFLGGTLGGFAFAIIGIYTLLIAIGCLLIGIEYANAKYRILLLKQKRLHTFRITRLPMKKSESSPSLEND